MTYDYVLRSALMHDGDSPELRLSPPEWRRAVALTDGKLIEYLDRGKVKDLAAVVRKVLKENRPVKANVGGRADYRAACHQIHPTAVSDKLAPSDRALLKRIGDLLECETSATGVITDRRFAKPE